MLNVKAEMVAFFLLLGGSDQLVGSQIARLSSLGIVVKSGVLWPGYHLNSSVVRNVLRGWITRGDIAAVWMTQPSAMSTVSCPLEACQQTRVVGFFAELQSDTPRRSLCIVPARILSFCGCRWTCACGFASRKRLTLFSVSVPAHLKLARQCDNFGHVCSFSGKSHQSWKGHFIHRAHRVRYSSFCCPCTGSVVPCQEQLD